MTRAPIQELCYVLPTGACVYGDKGYNSSKDETTLLEESLARQGEAGAGTA